LTFTAIGAVGEIEDVVAKNEAKREPRQMNKDRGAQALE
jgi:hypothetical protein